MNKFQLRFLGWSPVVAILFVVWFIVMFLAFFPMFSNNNVVIDDNAVISQRLSKAFNDLDSLRKQNLELRNLFAELNIGDLIEKNVDIDEVRKKLQNAESAFNSEKNGDERNEPTDQYEKMRRKLANNVEEMWYFFNAELNDMKKQVEKGHSIKITTIERMLRVGGEHKGSILNDFDTLQNVDGFEAWRKKEAKQLADLIQRRLANLQNPSNCKTARKLVCSLNKGCGYGCQIHHVAYCLLVAYGTERTLILNSKRWRYHKNGWEAVFKPLSDSCVDSSGVSQAAWPGDTDTQVLTLPIIDSVTPKPPYIPLAIPEDLAPRLLKLHGHPIVWLIGQFMKFILRPQPHLQKYLEDSVARMNFAKPIVGLHVRRTDKIGTEAAFHDIKEYMAAVEEYYNQLELTRNGKSVKRRVFIASDDPGVIIEAKQKYPNYEVIGDTQIAKTAAVSTRYTNSSLYGIILDIYLLSISDYLVCTFSSQVCRVAYELMQTFHVDASSKYRSLDEIYYYGGQSAHNRLAVLEHEAKSIDEINLQRGDLVGIAGNHWNGYSKGKNLRTNQIGLFPSFKVVDQPHIIKFPPYDNVPLTRDAD